MQVRRDLVIRYLFSQLANLAVLAALATLGWWGHHSQWKISKFSQLLSGASALDETPSEAERTAGAAGEYAAHNVNGSSVALPLSPIRFASPEAVRKSGIELVPVRTQAMTQEITALGVVTYDQSRLAQLSARARGTVWSVEKQVGQAVTKGEILAIIEAPEVGDAKADFLQALAAAELKATILNQLQTLARQLVPQRQIAEARAAVRAAQIELINSQQTLINLGLPIELEGLDEIGERDLARRMHFLGLPAGLAESLDPNSTTGNLLPLQAPFDGILIGREIVNGELVERSGTPQLVVADVSRMWIDLDVRKEDAPLLRRGQPLDFSINGVPGEVSGTVDWISTELDPKTRTLQARVRLENPLVHGADAGPEGQRLLRANMFGTARIRVRDDPQAVVVPHAAVQRDGDRALVFVSAPGEVFEPRAVRLGMNDDRFVEVLDGVSPGDLVAATGSHVLKAELERRRLEKGP